MSVSGSVWSSPHTACPQRAQCSFMNNIDWMSLMAERSVDLHSQTEIVHASRWHIITPLQCIALSFPLYSMSATTSCLSTRLWWYTFSIHGHALFSISLFLSTLHANLTRQRKRATIETTRWKMCIRQNIPNGERERIAATRCINHWKTFCVCPPQSADSKRRSVVKPNCTCFRQHNFSRFRFLFFLRWKCAFIFHIISGSHFCFPRETWMHRNNAQNFFAHWTDEK